MKIYHPTRDPMRQEQFDYLNKLSDKWFVKPIDLLYHRNVLVGFTMKYLPPTYFVLQNILQKDFCKTNGITSDVKQKAIKNLIDAIKSAHASGVIIGDLNQYNIMCDVHGNIKMLDVDSYETPKRSHSGVMLDEIRDHYYQGKVSKNSDYFALSILVFSMMTFTHPFKGIHKVWKKMSDRMLQKMPVFSKDPDLILPRIYEAMKPGPVLSQFERLYMGKVERFMVDLEPAQIASIIATAQLPKPSVVTKYTQKDLTVQEIMLADIEMVEVNGGRMLVKTRDDYRLYDCSNKGYVVMISMISRGDWDSLYIGKDTMIAIKNGNMFIQPNRLGTFLPVRNYTMESGAHITQMGSMLFILEEERLVKLDMDKGYGDVIHYHAEQVFSKAFNRFGGFFLRSGESQLFYHMEKSHPVLAKMPFNLAELYQVDNVGMIKFIEKTKGKTRVVNKYFKVKGSEVFVSARDADEVYKFAYQGDGENGFIFQPQDRFLRIIRTQDFEEVARHELDIVSTHSVVKHTPSGLVLWDDDRLWLLNKR
jgi:serine/threonine protein kinase